jgi:hypothetical protein
MHALPALSMGATNWFEPMMSSKYSSKPSSLAPVPLGFIWLRQSNGKLSATDTD